RAAREQHGEGGALGLAGNDVDPPAVRACNLLRNEKAKAKPVGFLASPLAAGHGVEQSAHNLGGHETHVVKVDANPVGGGAVDVHVDSMFLATVLDRVAEKVGKHLAKPVVVPAALGVAGVLKAECQAGVQDCQL